VKVVKSRPTWSYSDDDGVEHVDRIVALRGLASQVERLADLRRFEKLYDLPVTGKHDEDYYRERASLYRAEAARLEALPKRALDPQRRNAAKEGGKATHDKYASPELEDLIAAALARRANARPREGVGAAVQRLGRYRRAGGKARQAAPRAFLKSNTSSAVFRRAERLCGRPRIFSFSPATEKGNTDGYRSCCTHADARRRGKGPARPQAAPASP
jgi:hypothetical protein